jgi:hypothetical protein
MRYLKLFLLERFMERFSPPFAARYPLKTSPTCVKEEAIPEPFYE